MLSTTSTLALYDPQLPTFVSVDASAYGLGTVLVQQQPDGSRRPVVYTSRAFTPTEQWYAQIKKEVLALTWACERFQEYLLGIQFHLYTDHKPLVSLLGSKVLDILPVRIQVSIYDSCGSNTPFLMFQGKTWSQHHCPQQKGLTTCSYRN